MNDLDALHHLLDAYLHEDFADLHGSAWAAVDTYARDEPQYAPQLRREVTELLSTCKSEADLEDALVDLGIGYLPTGDGWDGHRPWLLAVADRVEEILRKSPAA